MTLLFAFWWCDSVFQAWRWVKKKRTKEQTPGGPGGGTVEEEEGEAFPAPLLFSLPVYVSILISSCLYATYTIITCLYVCLIVLSPYYYLPLMCLLYSSCLLSLHDLLVYAKHSFSPPHLPLFSPLTSHLSLSHSLSSHTSTIIFHSKFIFLTSLYYWKKTWAWTLTFLFLHALRGQFTICHASHATPMCVSHFPRRAVEEVEEGGRWRWEGEGQEGRRGGEGGSHACSLSTPPPLYIT